MPGARRSRTTGRESRAPAVARRRRWLVVAVVSAGIIVSAVFAGARIADAFWLSTDSSYPAAAEADALPQGNTPTSVTTTPNANSNTVAVQFPQATTLNGPYAIPASNYSVNRYPAAGGAAVAQPVSCSGSATITCDATNVPDGFWTFTDTPFYGANWVGQESAQSPAVTVDTTPPTVTVSYPASGSTYGSNWSGTISGTSTDQISGVASVAVAIENTTTAKWWSGSAFTASSATYVAATGTTSWTYPLATSKLVSGDSYSVTAQATDNVGNVGTSSASTFTYSTAAVTAAVTYPVKSTTYGGDWTGTIVGTASSPNTVSLVQVAIENTTTGTWWNGTSFSAASLTYSTASGTTSWTYSLAASNLVSGDSYSVTAHATDSLSNTGTSVAVTFTYNTTAPTVVVTYPLSGTTYGANWSGKLTGTATFTNTASNVQVAIENTTTAYWYNGSNFTTATSQTFNTASGTTSWTYTLAASKLVTGDSYTVIAEATDKAGNVGTSASYSFTYSTAAPTSTVVYPASNTITYGANWTGTITGTATFVNPASYVTVVIKNTTAALWWNGTSFAATKSTAVDAIGTTSWSYGLAAANLVSGDTYTIIAHAYDTAGNVGTSATRTFKYNTTPPTATVTYPVNGATYGPNYTGTITGTASFTVSASNVTVAIENTSTALWWNGSSFAASSQTFETATGTTSWSYALAAAKLASGDSYSVVAEATDTAGNLGTSATVNFTYYPIGLAGLAWLNTSGGTPTCGAISATRTCTVSGVGLSGTWSADVEMVNSSGSPLSNVSGSAITFTCTATNPVGGPVENPASPGSLTLATSATASTPLSITGQGVSWSVTETCTATIQGTAYSLDIAASH